MYDIERINSLVDDLLRFSLDLKEINLNESNINDLRNLHASAMLIFAIMNRTIDLAEEILVKNDLPMPSSYSDCFPALAKAGLIDKKLADLLESFIKQRGLFAHHYYDMNKKIILKLCKDTSIAAIFIEKVKELVRKSLKSK